MEENSLEGKQKISLETIATFFYQSWRQNEMLDSLKTILRRSISSWRRVNNRSINLRFSVSFGLGTSNLIKGLFVRYGGHN